MSCTAAAVSEFIGLTGEAHTDACLRKPTRQALQKCFLIGPIKRVSYPAGIGSIPLTQFKDNVRQLSVLQYQRGEQLSCQSPRRNNKPIAEDVRRDILQRRERGIPIRKIAERAGVSVGSVAKILKTEKA